MECDDLSKRVIGCAMARNVSFLDSFVSFVVRVTTALN